MSIVKMKSKLNLLKFDSDVSQLGRACSWISIFLFPILRPPCDATLALCTANYFHIKIGIQIKFQNTQSEPLLASHSSEFMGKTFQAAQLTYERSKTTPAKYFFWYLSNWTSTDLWCVVLYVMYSTTNQRSVEVQFGRYQKNILQEWSMVKNLSYVSCAAWNVFPINSLISPISSSSRQENEDFLFGIFRDPWMSHSITMSALYELEFEL